MTPSMDHITERFGEGWIFGIGCGEGWYSLIFELDAELAKLDPNYEIAQIKEKFGALRFYCSSEAADEATFNAMNSLIAIAENRSMHICEACGAAGVLGKRNHWLMTRCPGCAPDGWEPVRDVQ